MNAADREAQIIRDWLFDVMKQTGLKPTPLAKEAGLSPSTVLRALDQENPSSLERRSIRKIVDKFGVPAPPIAQPQIPAGEAPPSRYYPPGFDEAELLPIAMDVPIFAGQPLTSNQYVKKTNTRALELVGYLPGDEVLFDMARRPEAGDVVEAQVYIVGAAETVFRFYDPPYIVARTTDPSVKQKPQPVDGISVKIVAVAVKSLRGIGR